MNKIELAYKIAVRAHADQVRPYTGAPYIGHPARVVGILKLYVPTASEEMIAAAWLHDVVEDGAVTLDALAESFGTWVAVLVEELTKPNEPRTVQAMVIKACDLLDNVGTIADHAPRAQAQAYLVKKGAQVLRICERLAPYYPDLVERLGQAYLANRQAAFS